MARSKALEYGSFLFVLLLQVFSETVVSSSVIKFLPGFDGPLPFHLETGYIGVGDSEDVQLFYYFIKSQRNAKEDPLVLWLTGGPGCSALSAFIAKIGPMIIKEVEYNGSLPTWISNPYSWTQVANIIFIDLPAGAGFSFARTPLAAKTGDLIQANQAAQFLRKWLMDHPEFLQNPFYIGGDSYSGIPLPAVVQLLSDGNDEGVKPSINLKGYLLGNAATDGNNDVNSRVPYAHGMGLISDELYELLKRSCKGEYQNIDPSNVECRKYVDDFSECISDINQYQILDPNCPPDSLKRKETNDRTRSLNEKSREFLNFDQPLPVLGCDNYGYQLCTFWANDNNVRKALHVKEGSIDKWLRCNFNIPYKKDYTSSIKYHAYLGSKGYRALVYSGDHDMVIPFVATQAWIRSLNYSIVDDWRPWNVQGQVAGYTRTYSNKMTFATVKGAGHVPPLFKPEQCFAMFKRWMLQEPL